MENKTAESSFFNILNHKIEARKAENSFRILTTESNKIDFYSNDYLGLSRNQVLQKNIDSKYKEITEINKLGATGSRLISGNSIYFEKVESYLAQVFESESALIFNSGYVANLALLSSFPQKGDTILYDELCHASLKDGMRLSFADRYSFKHNDLLSLEILIKKAKGQVFIITESVFSMDGDAAPLAHLADLAQKYEAQLFVDEAHSTGIYGKNGSGLVSNLGLSSKIPIRVHTFGKGMGSHGACITGPKIVKDYLINFARSFIYTTAMTLHNLVSIHESFKYLELNSDLAKKLHFNIQYFKEKLKNNTQILPSDSAIQIVMGDCIEQIKSLANKIHLENMMVKPILSPTVKLGSERLRICLHSFNTTNEIDSLIDCLKQ
ncbi:MAG: 8-amino-7-oxononanoate synthase [Cytophagales bacterium]|nr:MAG: 8-amino-7-oxononanoate synthase [Cytophagales bacterium]